MGKDKKQQKQQTASYSDVAKQQPGKNTTIRKPQPAHVGSKASEQEPLINLDSDHASSSDEAGNNKNPVPAKRARTIPKDAMDEDISSPISQQKTASSSANFPQSEINTAPRTNFDQPPVDQTSKSSKPPFERPLNSDMLQQDPAVINKENSDKENNQSPVESSGNSGKND